MTWNKYFGIYFDQYLQIFMLVAGIWILLSWSINGDSSAGYKFLFGVLICTFFLVVSKKIRNLLQTKHHPKRGYLFFWSSIGVIYAASLLVVSNHSVPSLTKVATCFVVMFLLSLVVIGSSLFIYDQVILVNKKAP